MVTELCAVYFSIYNFSVLPTEFIYTFHDFLLLFYNAVSIYIT
jgi:hypothetical protein